MKYLLLTSILLLYQNQEVTAIRSFFEFLSEQFSYFTNSFSDTFKHLTNTVRNYFAFSKSSKLSHNVEHLNQKTSKTFTDFVDQAAAENESEVNERLRFEPTALMSTPQLATFHGRRMESHTIYSRDGYLLTLHRIAPTPRNSWAEKNYTVILHHGLLGSSADWILLGPRKSLPYILSDAGYDVWLANARGNYYSRGHATKTVDSASYWKFTWQEMGQIDLAAAIDYIRYTKKSNDPIDFIGHSMGATALLVLLSTTPQYNEYLRMGILLAPLAYMGNAEGPLKVMTDMATNPPQQLLKIIGPNEFIPSRRLPKSIAIKYCRGPLLFCGNPLYFITGGIPEDVTFDESFVARLVYHVPAGTSTKTILHYAQLVKSGKFHKFNDVSSEFPLSRITLPIALLSSSDDWLATIPDVLRLYFNIKNPIDHYIIRGVKLHHNDFVWGQDANELVFSKIVEFLNNGLDWLGYKPNEISEDNMIK